MIQGMKIKYLLFLIPLLFSSCIEIIDDLTLHLDGSGVFKYTINLSSSKLKVNSILALDSLNGKKVPSLSQIEVKIIDFRTKLAEKPGITSVKTEFNSVDFILKLTVDFTSVAQLQEGIKSVLQEMSKEKEKESFEGDWITWDGKTLNRVIPTVLASKVKSFENTDIDLLKNGTYTSISRFDKPIQKTSNEKCKLNPAKTASMLQVNTYELKMNNALIENTITLTP